MLLMVAADASEVAARAGVQVYGYSYFGGRRAQPVAAIGGDGRYRVRDTNGFADHLVIEGGLLGVAPLTAGGAFVGGSGVARLGLVFGGFEFTVGAQLRIDATRSPLAALPAFTVAYRPGTLGVRAGFFDQAGGAIGHLAIEYLMFGFGYVAPLGAEAYARLPLREKMALDVRFFGYSSGSAFVVSLLVGVVFEEQP